ncbi:rare lipoprotein A [Thiogranum longum]|uniref:Endolytic peptidoglycan transglycosylase RlpA n=1 Tax=Thiogranum longum TaxID=1537524 RepID=A0A4R1HIH8_9GAMM|nr:septal ring lytic transglycosylase RlpA family protein [Thiogranum longum]TCK19239.1 rare lipoprotein A [Thiogranum longum]
MPTRKIHNRVIPTCSVLALAGLGFVLSSCSSTGGGRYSQRHDSAPDRLVDVSQVANAVPRAEPRSRYGNPASYVVRGRRYHTLTDSRGYRERGVASWYGTKFHGHRTSSGESYDMYAMSAAHKSLPLPTYARVTNLRNGKSVVVKINDRGPFHDNRLIDLSYAAASQLGILGEGTGLVEVESINPDQPAQHTRPTGNLASKPKTHTRTVKQAGAGTHKPLLYLQVGAFLSRDNAERLKRRLIATTSPEKLHISEGNANHQHIYRVRIGPLDSVESADQLTQSLQQHGIESPRVIID